MSRSATSIIIVSASGCSVKTWLHLVELADPRMCAPEGEVSLDDVRSGRQLLALLQPSGMERREPALGAPRNLDTAKRAYRRIQDKVRSIVLQHVDHTPSGHEHGDRDQREPVGCELGDMLAVYSAARAAPLDVSAQASISLLQHLDAPCE
jgi:hypothetical protein